MAKEIDYLTKLLGLGNAIDRYSILKMKEFRGVNFPPEELETIRSYISNSYDNAHEVLTAVDLAIANANTWDLESKMREGKETKSYEEIGRCSMLIRESNGHRVKCINDFNKATNTGCLDLKIDHMSDIK